MSSLGNPYIYITTQKALNAGTSLLQSFKPLGNVCQHVCAFHCYAHDTTRQVRAHHFCGYLNEELRQCLLYVSDSPRARLIGVEYIISERMCKELPLEEKKYWHSHAFEVTSGQLMALGVPLPVANRDAEKLVNSYGKTWHFWQVDAGHPLPYGPPQLMMSFTQDGQLDAAAVEARDKDCGCDTFKARESRQYLVSQLPELDPAADHPWRTGTAWQTSMQQQPAKLAGADQVDPATGKEALASIKTPS